MKGGASAAGEDDRAPVGQAIDGSRPDPGVGEKPADDHVQTDADEKQAEDREKSRRLRSAAIVQKIAKPHHKMVNGIVYLSVGLRTSPRLGRPVQSSFSPGSR